jgi:hypothetical protein
LIHILLIGTLSDAQVEDIAPPSPKLSAEGEGASNVDIHEGPSTQE